MNPDRGDKKKLEMSPKGAALFKQNFGTGPPDIYLLDPEGYKCACGRPADYVTTCNDGMPPLALCRPCAEDMPSTIAALRAWASKDKEPQ